MSLASNNPKSLDAAGRREASAADSNAAGRAQTGLKGLVTVARHMGVDWSLPRLMHVHGSVNEPDAGQLAGVARAEGLKSAVRALDWGGLHRFRKLAPFLARLTNGASAFFGNLITSRSTPSTRKRILSSFSSDSI